MSLAKVKTNMLSVTISISTLETRLKQLNSMISSVSVKTIERLGNYSNSSLGSINQTGTTIDRMYKLNRIELDIFFMEYNEESEKVMGALMNLAENVKQLAIECAKIATIVEYLDSATYEFKMEKININNMKQYFSKDINTVLRQLRNFKNNTSIHNNKLGVGE